MPEITFLEFVATLPKKNFGRPKLIKRIGELLHFHRCSIGFARKSDDMPEIVELFSRQDRSPVVDKRTGFIFGVDGGYHEKFRAILFEYHDPVSAEGWGERVNSRSYITRGLGYYISSMQKNVIVCGTDYREDSWDKDLFPMYTVFRDEVGR